MSLIHTGSRFGQSFANAQPPIPTILLATTSSPTLSLQLKELEVGLLEKFDGTRFKY